MPYVVKIMVVLVPSGPTLYLHWIFTWLCHTLVEYCYIIVPYVGTLWLHLYLMLCPVISPHVGTCFHVYIWCY